MVVVARFGQHRSETHSCERPSEPAHLKWLLVKVALGREYGVRCPDAAPLCTRTAVTSLVPLEGITYGCKRLGTTEEGAA